MGFRGIVYEALLDALAVLFPLVCAGCGRHDRALCPDCRAALTVALDEEPSSVELGAEAPGQCLTVWFGCRYGGVVSALLHSFKESGRVDVAGPLGAALGAVLAVAAAHAGVAHGEGADSSLGFVTAPSTAASLRRRGYNPVDALMRRSGSPLTAAGTLTFNRSTLDQAGLDQGGRALNLAGAVAGSRSLRGRRILIVDDVVTTGSTLLECRRAVHAAGGMVVGAATIAHTFRTHTQPQANFQ
jgi:predicted amidophosphoribosyltransferase